MKQRYVVLIVCILASMSCTTFTSCSVNQSYDVTLDTLLDEMLDRDAVTRYPVPEYRQAQVSSYDRRTVGPGQPGWWANDDGAGYERIDTVDGRLEKVLCDLQGAGAITRIWMTTKEKFGTLRIYFDGAKKAQIEIPAYDMARFPIKIPIGLSLTHTHYAEAMEGVGGNTFFLPLPFEKACKITFEEPDINVKIPRYYHIGYRTYSEGVRVKTFSLAEAQSLMSKIGDVSRELMNPSDIDFAGEISKSELLNECESLSFKISNESGNKISRLVVKSDKIESMHIKCYFDGVMTVNAPLAHFAGVGTGAPEVDGWWLKHKNGKVECLFPMPFKNDAEIVITNCGSPANVSVVAFVGEYEWMENSMYFHSSFRNENAIPVSPEYDSDDNLDWNFMTIKGRGNYVGDLLSLYNHAIDWYGEGDEKIFVDGEDFPSFMGTGTEDYFNCSWAPVVPFLTPYGGAPRADEASSHGYNAFLRTRILDNIPFKHSFKFDIEMSSWHHGTVDYNATSFWYGDASDTVNSTIE